jgi:hypothetical protein
MGGTVSVHCVEMIDHCAMPSVITQNSGWRWCLGRDPITDSAKCWLCIFSNGIESKDGSRP